AGAIRSSATVVQTRADPVARMLTSGLVALGILPEGRRLNQFPGRASNSVRHRRRCFSFPRRGGVQLGGDNAKAQLDSMKGWLALHNAAVMTVLFLVFGINLIAKGIPQPTG